MKKILLGILTVFLLSVTAFAYPPVTVYVDGEKLNFDQLPIIENDRTLVPMRKIFEALDAEVFWDEPNQSVTAVQGEDVILFRIGETGLYKNNQLIYTMPVSARIVNDRTLVPLRAVAESLGAEVGWDGVHYVVDIHSAENPSERPEENEQDIPQKGGYAKEVRAKDGTVVLNVDLRCDEVTAGAGAAAINDAMAKETYGQGQAFLQAYSEKALREYAKNPKDFRAYYYMGTYGLTRETNGYVSFLVSVSSYDGTQEGVKYFSHTYRLNSGKECALSDLVSDSREDIEYLWQISFEALIQADSDAFYSDAESRLKKNLDKVDFYLTKNGIAFYLSPGVIAPDEVGAVSFEITYQFT